MLDFLQTVSSRCKNGSLCLLIYHGWFMQVGQPELVMANLRGPETSVELGFFHL